MKRMTMYWEQEVKEQTDHGGQDNRATNHCKKIPQLHLKKKKNSKKDTKNSITWWW